MVFFWVLLAIVVVAVVAYKFRVPLLARILGQSESRVQRSIERRKR
jgi:F0F1-type ATP synthase membrane subunit b/b'